jgi:hypothetical protein
MDDPETVSRATLRVTDQETARVVAIHRRDGRIVGAGCLLDGLNILTCRHVVLAALKDSHESEAQNVFVTLIGIDPPRTFDTSVVKVEKTPGTQNDLALLRIEGGSGIELGDANFASPLRHTGKDYSVLGFPAGDRQGRNVSGKLHAADATGLVQMDGLSSLSVLGGFSGAPVWCPNVHAFVGIVVTELSSSNVAWCIPSSRLCAFWPEMRVRFRIPKHDRPVINDWYEDDPNKELFGLQNGIQGRTLSCRIHYWGKGWRKYRVELAYRVALNSPRPRGQTVTFVNYPDFARARADSYELFAELRNGEATQEIYAEDLFTVAAVGDGGDTALTLDLNGEPIIRPKKKKQPKKKTKNSTSKP